MDLAPETLPIRDERPPRAVRKRVDAALARGALVALPTETVYGLAARADLAEAVARLRRAKGSEDARGFTWHVGAREALRRFPRVSPVATRLAERYWPGPLTLVLPGIPPGLESVAHDDWTGVRLPAHLGTAGLLASLHYPVILTSANPSGAAPLTDAAAVSDAFGADLELVVDGGPSRMGEASGVLRVGRGRFELLREGLLPIDDLRRTAGLRIGFVCTGNTCRSPMAEAIARDLLRERLGLPPGGDVGTFGFEVLSAGVFAPAGSPASEHAVTTLAERGIDLSRHVSSPAVPETIAGLDRVYCLTRPHLDALVKTLPPGRARHVLLLDPGGEDVPDPIGGTLDAYRASADRIAVAVRARLDEWA